MNNSGLATNVWILLIAGALGLCAAPMIVFVGGIIGSNLAPDPMLSTLPVAALVIGTALFVMPVSHLMRKYGRKRVFMAGALWSAISALVGSYAIVRADFAMYVVSSLMLGGALAVVQQFRFAAMESVLPEYSAKAVSIIMLGGLISAVVGPELAQWGREILAVKFAGAYLLLAAVSLVEFMVLGFYKPAQVADNSESEHARPLSLLLKNRLLWVAVLSSTVGYAVMSFIMTATPISMHVMMDHSLQDTKWVIQSHILAMFLPSLFSGFLISRYGVYKLMVWGLLCFVSCIVVAVLGQSVFNYWFSLVLLGVGWNFLFVGGTVLLPRTHDPLDKFKAQGFHDFFVFIFQASASITSGVVIYWLGWNQLIVLAIPIVLVQVFMVMMWRIKYATDE